MAEVQDVEAEVIEDDMGTFSKAEAWFAKAEQTVSEAVTRYKVPDEITSESERRDIYDARTELRKDIASIDGERKKMLRSVETALKSFKNRVKDVLGPASELDGTYTKLLDDYDSGWIECRKAALREDYEDLAPYIALPLDGSEPLIPFERIWDKYGKASGRSKNWEKRSLSEADVAKKIEEVVGDIARDLIIIDKEYDGEERNDVRAKYFEVLNLGEAIRLHREDVERRQRVVAFDMERRSIEEPFEPTAGFSEVPEPIPAEPSDLFAELVESYPEMVPEPAPAPVPAPAPAPAPAPEPVQQEQAKPWVVIIPSATKSQMQRLGSILSANGLTGSIKAGTISEVCAREVSNG